MTQFYEVMLAHYQQRLAEARDVKERSFIRGQVKYYKTMCNQ